MSFYIDLNLIFIVYLDNSFSKKKSCSYKFCIEMIHMHGLPNKNCTQVSSVPVPDLIPHWKCISNATVYEGKNLEMLNLEYF